LSTRQRIKGQIRDNFEKGYVYSRKAGARGRYIWSLGWAFLTIEEYNTLVAFFDANIGGSFSYTDFFPTTSGGSIYNDYTVMFSAEELPEEQFISNHGVALKGLQIEEK
jgi:hypothetical protein